MRTPEGQRWTHVRVPYCPHLIQVGGWLAKSILQQSLSAARELSKPPYSRSPACQKGGQLHQCFFSSQEREIVWNLCLASFHHGHWLPAPAPWHSWDLEKVCLLLQDTGTPGQILQTFQTKMTYIFTLIGVYHRNNSWETEWELGLCKWITYIFNYYHSLPQLLCRPWQDSIALSPSQGNGGHSTWVQSRVFSNM